MDKEKFKAIEHKLYDFYEGEKIIDSLKFKIDLVQEQIKEIEEKIKGNKVNISGDGLKAISYGERVQTTSTRGSYAEQALIRELEFLEKEFIRKKEIKIRLEETLRDKELDNKILEYNLKFLSERDKKLLEDKYKNNIPTWKIAEDIHISLATVKRIKNKVLKDIGNRMLYLNSELKMS